LDFLNSPGARSIRILSEFLEPLERFRREGIKDTIVFFGSARIIQSREAKKIYRLILAKCRLKKRLTANDQRKLETARRSLELSRYYDDAVELARRLTEWSIRKYNANRFVVCSGGGPGIMEAANRGAHLARGKSVGLNISLPFEQASNRFVTPSLNFEFHYFFMRKFWFVYLSKALIMFPGGFGTMDELMEVLTLMQTGKIKKKMTVVLYGRDYWKKVIDFDFMLKSGVISPGDLRLFTFADTPQEAFEYVARELEKNYPAIRS